MEADPADHELGLLRNRNGTWFNQYLDLIKTDVALIFVNTNPYIVLNAKLVALFILKDIIPIKCLIT